MTAAHSGGLGDIVYAVPVMRQLNITKIFIKRSYYYEPYGDLYRASCRLLQQAGFEVLPTSGDYHPMEFEPGLKFDYNMDKFRLQPRRGTNHIITSYNNQFKTTATFDPWLTITGSNTVEPEYSLIHLTPRWRTGSLVNWRKVLASITGKVYFIGFQNEWVEFCSRYGNIEWLPCADILEMAIFIRDCKALYCNQSVALTLAQGMDKVRYLESKPHRTNTHIKSLNEYYL